MERAERYQRERRVVAPGEGSGVEALEPCGHARHIRSLRCAGVGSAGGTAAATFPSLRGASSAGAAGALLAAAPAVVAAAAAAVAAAPAVAAAAAVASAAAVVAVAPATAAGFVPPRAGFDKENGACSPACFAELGCTSSVDIMFCAQR